MHWSLRMILDMPKAVIVFRRNHRMMARLQKIEEKEGAIASFKSMMEYPSLQVAIEEIYIDMLPEVMEKSDTFDSDEMEWFLLLGEAMGVLKRMEDDSPLGENNLNQEWKKWEEEI